MGADPEAPFSGKAGRTRLCSGPAGSCLLVGLGKAAEVDADAFRSAVGTAVRAAAGQELDRLAVDSGHLDRLGLDGDMAAECVTAALLAGYRFTAFKSDPGEEDAPSSLAILGGGGDMRARLDRAVAVAEGVRLARDLVNTPSNVATPEHLAGVARELAAGFGFAVQVFGPEEIVAMGIGHLRLGLPRQRHTRPASSSWTRTRPGAAPGLRRQGRDLRHGRHLPQALGKMHEMKGDMAGAAAILGLFKAVGLAGGAPRRVVGLLPCTENVPGSRATKPGDVVTAMNGKTVEILNTDAEGRLILADALAYGARFEPAILVDLATLTGACLVALGTKVAAVFATTAELDRRIREGGSRVWRTILAHAPVEGVRRAAEKRRGGPKNIATREGGAIYAAMFLKNFVPEGVDWAHLDIAGPAWTDENASVFRPGGTGFGVRTLWELVGMYAEGGDGELAL